MTRRAVTSGPPIAPRPLARILEHVWLFRRRLEAAMDRAQFDPMLSGLLDQVIAVEETLSPVLQESERAPHATRAQATTCPYCSAPLRCCGGPLAVKKSNEALREHVNNLVQENPSGVCASASATSQSAGTPLAMTDAAPVVPGRSRPVPPWLEGHAARLSHAAGGERVDALVAPVPIVAATDAPAKPAS